ncbi:hypothetical protein C7B80_16260 [Cyanosarcina cf. burmensis CCALA 770]|nr:hypothetical protein C7B80_16260 [Cyanosarcina cf. burmensis CCALA 770]
MKTKYLLTLSLLTAVLGTFETAIAQVTTNESSIKILPDLLNSELMHSAAPATSANNSNSLLTPKTEFSVFPVGINIGDRNVKSGALVRGQEDGRQALNFANWRLSYDDIIQVLKFNVTTLADGQIEVRSAGIVTRLNPKKLRTDPELGLVFSIQDLQTLFGVKAKFDLNEYAIILEVPWLTQPATNTFEETETPVVLNGLQRLYPGKLNIAGMEQRVNATGTGDTTPTYTGDTLAVGSAFGGSWFVRTTQSQLQDFSTWKLAEAQFLRQTDFTDYFVGSQPTFWQSQETRNYWGLTLVQRQGFSPPQSLSAGSSDPRQRLQAAVVGRTIAGKAEPGTLVRLVRGFGSRAISEVLVDSSGIYRFENIKSDRAYDSNYRVFLYPQGRLTAPPEIREASFSTVPGQIPAGASAFVVSGGWQSDTDTQIPSMRELRGGVAGRWGLSPTLTVGLGGVYDDSLQGLAEIFWRPENFPLQVAVSALAGSKLEAIADIQFTPSPNFSALLSSDRYSSRLNLNWQLSRSFSLYASANSRDATSGGVQFSFSGKNVFTFARAGLDTKNRLRWYLLQGLGRLELNLQGNEVGTNSALTYNLSQDNGNTGHSLLLNYETRSQGRSDRLLTLGWQYRSPQRASDGNYLWEAQLGYGMNSGGSGLFASLGTTVLPGVMLRGRYQGVSLTSDESSFSVELVSSLGLQAGISPGDRHTSEFRTQGGLLIQPFFDRNNNSKRDPSEEIYTENCDLLLILNNQPLTAWRPKIQHNRILLRLPPNTYRLDFDPAGFPPDWQAHLQALAVVVSAGSYTPVFVPLVPAFSRTGVVIDMQNKPIAGATVEAIGKSGQRKFSVTNSAGVYYLEGLSQGEYTLTVNGRSHLRLKLDTSTKPFQELNLKAKV